jgi:hypothetical protein
MPALRVEMTHGDKAKAKAGRKSQASVKERSAKGENGKGPAKGAGKVAEVVKAAAVKAVTSKGGVVKAAKQAVAGKKGVTALKSSDEASGKGSTAKERSGESGSRGKARGGNEGGAPIADARLANAFKHAVSKYPNAFRKLTD